MTRPASCISDRSGMGRRLAMLALFLALLFQGFVVQTHAHRGIDPVRIAAVPAGTPVVAQAASRETPALPNCLLCEEQALFGAYLLADPATIRPPVVTAFAAAPADPSAYALASRFRGWRSRAPPILTA